MKQGGLEWGGHRTLPSVSQGPSLNPNWEHPSVILSMPLEAKVAGLDSGTITPGPRSGPLQVPI